MLAVHRVTMDEAERSCVPERDQGAVEAFFACVKTVVDPKSLQTMMPALQRRLIQPPTALFSAVLKQQFSDGQVRQLLFFPEPPDMALYPKLLVGDPASPTDLNASAANKAQAAVLGHLFLVHCRSWQRARPFIEAGGLTSLVCLLGHPNRLLASQALQLLLLATHPDMYDWHSPPGYNSNSLEQEQQQAQQAAETSTHSTKAAVTGSTQQFSNSSDTTAGSTSIPQQATAAATACAPPEATADSAAHPSQGPDGRLWLQLLQLHDGPLLPRLLALSPDAWPGSGQQALQLLAFYLSWLRAWWSKDGVLQLSPGLLAGLAAWSSHSTASSEERQLAAALLQDFGAAGPAPAAAAGAADAYAADTACDASAGSAGSVDAGFEPAVEFRVVADRTQINSGPGSEAARLKAAGNDAFKANDWATAIRFYSAALDVPAPYQALLDEAPRRAVCHTNRAAAYCERVWELQAAAAAARQAEAACRSGSGNDSTTTKKLITELEPGATASAGGGGGSSSSSSSHRASTGSSSSSSWLEVGGSLDGMQLDSSPDSLAKQLDAAVLDCRAALQLVPRHTKAHHRLATALRAQGKLVQALKAAEAAEQYAATTADAAAAARLAAAIRQQQQQHSDAQPHHSAAAGKPVGGQTIPVAAQVAQAFTSSSNPAGSSMAAVRSTSGQAAADPLGQLLQQFAAVVGSSTRAGSSKAPAGASDLQRCSVARPRAAMRAATAAAPPAKARGNVPAAAGKLEIKAPTAAAAAAHGSSMNEPDEQGLTRLVLPKKRGKKGVAAGWALVQVLASSNDGEEAAAAAAADAATGAEAEQAGQAAAARAPTAQSCDSGFIMREFARTKRTIL